jgi:hypothetical protein
VRRSPSEPRVPLVLSARSRNTVPDHSTFSKNRHGRFRESDLLRHRTLFETVLARCIEQGFVGGEGFAVDASLIIEGAAGLPPDAVHRATQEYLAVLDDAAFGAATRNRRGMALPPIKDSWTHLAATGCRRGSEKLDSPASP